MILPDLVLNSRANQHWSFAGLDSIEECLNKKHFKNYPYEISYDFNSRGFRDKEWPVELDALRKSIWAIGDSFTVGVGTPIEHNWCNLLETAADCRVINVSFDGASNHWIARRAKQILQQVAPEIMIIQWSYLNRYEHPDQSLSDEDRRMQFDSQTFYDIKKLFAIFVELISGVETVKNKTKLIHSFVPKSGVGEIPIIIKDIWSNIRGENWPQVPTSAEEFYQLENFVVDELKYTFKEFDFIQQYFEVCDYCLIPEIEYLDRARDFHHYDKVTAENFVNQVLQLLNHQASI